MNQYTSVADFAADESFQNYCLDVDEAATKKWTAFIEANPSQLEIIEEARLMILMLQLRPQKIEKPAQLVKSTKQNETIWAWKPVIAASILLALVAAYFFMSDNEIATEYLTQVANKEVRKFSLMDGSTVTLNIGAELKYASSWSNRQPREVWLKGDAQFDVADEPTEGGPKFIVHTNEGDIRVLGTTFVVDQNEEKFAVILSEGKLVFSSQEHEDFLIEPGEGVIKRKDAFIKKDVNAIGYNLWTQTDLSFSNIPLFDITQALTQSFDLGIEIRNKKLLEKRITASVPNSDPNFLLTAISELYDITMTIENDQIILN